MKAAQRVFFFLVMTLVFVTVASPASAASIQSEVLYYVNVERVNAGLQPVVFDQSMNLGAAVRAKEIQVNFAHKRPDGRDVKSVMESLFFTGIDS